MTVKELHQPIAWTKAHAALARQLEDVVSSRLLDPLEILLGGGTLRESLKAGSKRWACDLLGEDDQTARLTAIRIVSALYPSDRPFDPPSDWWATPLGQAVVHRAGHPSAEAVSYSIAGAMLGVTRQAVHDLVRRGRLERHPAGGVKMASVQKRLAARHPERLH
jgi:hypothetical protein